MERSVFLCMAVRLMDAVEINYYIATINLRKNIVKYQVVLFHNYFVTRKCLEEQNMQE